MLELAIILYLIAISVGMGVVWYTSRRSSRGNWTGLAAFPPLGVVIGQPLLVSYQGAEPGRMASGLNLLVAPPLR